MLPDRKKPDDEAARPAAPAPDKAADERAALRERVGRAIIDHRYQDACAILNGLSMAELLATLDSLYGTYRLQPLTDFVPRARGIFKERLLAALYAVTGAAEAKITPALALLPPDQQQLIRARLAARQQAASALPPLLPGGLLAPGSLLPAGPLPPGPIPPAPAPADSAVVEAVQKAVSAATEGVTVRRGPLSLNIAVTGATAELRKGGLTLSAEASPTGSVTIGTAYRNVAFSASLSAERWDMQLTFPLADPIPNLSLLGKVFGEGEQALRNIAGEVSRFGSLQDVPAIKDAIKPHTQPVKDAVDALKGIAGAAEAKPNRPIFGVTASGPAPDAAPGAPGVPAGIELQGTITVLF